MRNIATLLLVAAAFGESPTLRAQIVFAENVAEQTASAVGIGATYGQTFTATSSGMLSTVDFAAQRWASPLPASVDVEFFDLTSGASGSFQFLSESTVGTQAMTDLFATTWLTADFSTSEIAIMEGHQYAFLISYDHSNGQLLPLNCAAGYSDGALVIFDGANYNIAYAADDLQFRVTAIPEPATSALAVGVIAILLVVARCLRKRVSSRSTVQVGNRQIARSKVGLSIRSICTSAPEPLISRIRILAIFGVAVTFGPVSAKAQATLLNFNTSSISVIPGVSGGIFIQDGYVYACANAYDDNGAFVAPEETGFRDGTSIGDFITIIPGDPNNSIYPIPVPLIGQGTINSEYHLALSDNNRLFFVSTLTGQGALETALSNGNRVFNGVTSAYVTGQNATVWLSATDGEVFHYNFTVDGSVVTAGALVDDGRNIGAGHVLGEFYFATGASTPSFLASQDALMFDYRADGSIATYALPADWTSLGFTITDVTLETRVGLTPGTTQLWLTGKNPNDFPNGYYLQGADLPIVAAIPEPACSAAVVALVAIVYARVIPRASSNPSRPFPLSPRRGEPSRCA